MKETMRDYFKIAVIIIIMSIFAYCLHVEIYSRLMHVVYSIMNYTVIGVEKHVKNISNILYVGSFILSYVLVYYSLKIIYKCAK